MNFILSHTLELDLSGTKVVKSIDEALGIIGVDTDLWVIGGALVYAQCMGLARQAVITEIEADFEGDAKAPHFDASWTEVKRTRHTAANGLIYSIIYLEKT